MKKRKQIVDFHINEETIADSSFPVDYSFFKYKELKPVECEQARITRLGDTPQRGRENKKYLTRGVWLNNNKLVDLKGLRALVEAVLEFPQKLAWLDLSYNYIKKIDEVILQFPNLSVIHLHGNRISDITEVAKLIHLKKLRNVTFHGNPMIKQKDYRSIVMAYLPGIVHLDFQPVLKTERLQPIHPTALKYVKAFKLEKAKGDGESESEKEMQPVIREAQKAFKLEEAKDDGERESEKDMQPVVREAQKFAKRGGCACFINRRLLRNTRLE